MPLAYRSLLAVMVLGLSLSSQAAVLNVDVGSQLPRFDLVKPGTHHYLRFMRTPGTGANQPIDIWTRGTSEGDSLAAAAVDRFCLSLGSVAGDIALAQGGFAGVVIAGGLGYRIRETLLASGFAQRFRAKGRFESLMAGIPVKLIVHPQPGLFGAAAAFAAEHGEPA